MKRIRSTVYALLLFSSCSMAQPTRLEPIESWQSRRPNWQDDKTELSYIATRCAALYGIVGTVFSIQGATEEDKKRSADIRVRSLKLMVIGSFLGKEVGMSDENFSQRFRGISEQYGEVVRSNRTIHNNIFHGFIEYDWKFCIDLEKMVDASRQKK
jgi:hypothetical protein